VPAADLGEKLLRDLEVDLAALEGLKARGISFGPTSRRTGGTIRSRLAEGKRARMAGAGPECKDSLARLASGAAIWLTRPLSDRLTISWWKSASAQTLSAGKEAGS
jgi:hypothetical protein